MEDAGPPVNEQHSQPQGASSEQEQHPSSAQTTAQQGPHPDTVPAVDAMAPSTTTNKAETANADVDVDQSLNSSNDTETAAPTASESAPAQDSSTLNAYTDIADKSDAGVAVATTTTTTQEDQKDEGSAMDVDTVPPVVVPSTFVDTGAQDHPMDSQPAERTSLTSAQPIASTDGTVAGAPETKSTAEQGKASETSEASTLTTPAANAEATKVEGNGEAAPETVPADASSSTSAPTNTAAEGEAAGPAITGEQPETVAAESQVVPEVPPGPPPKPVYVPQFKFTTFAPMTPIPVRNITNTFQKTDKNYVLKELAAGKQRRRKRKAEQASDESGEANPEGEAQENGGDGESSTAGGESDILKRKRGDDFSAIRKGIFADEDDNEDEDKEDQENEENGPNDANEDDDEDDFSSDSDSEESVMNEMDENGETRSVSLQHPLTDLDYRNVFTVGLVCSATQPLFTFLLFRAIYSRLIWARRSLSFIQDQGFSGSVVPRMLTLLSHHIVLLAGFASLHPRQSSQMDRLKQMLAQEQLQSLKEKV